MNRALPSPPILLDTHYWIWLQLGLAEEFTGRTRQAVELAVHYGRSHHVAVV